MMYLLDTNVCIRFLNQRSSILTARMTACRRADVVLCDVVKAELYYGAHHSAAPVKNLAVLEGFLAGFASFPFNGAAAAVYGKIKSELARCGALIGPNDLLIAATAIANDLTLVSHNTSEFCRIQGPAIEDWEEAPTKPEHDG